MKATGIVRRIDDLGRVVIPKEIRRKIGLQEGAPLEIFTIKENGKIMVVLSEYDAGMDTVKIKSEDYGNAISELDALSNEVCAYAPNDMVDRLREIAESFKNLLPREE